MLEEEKLALSFLAVLCIALAISLAYGYCAWKADQKCMSAGYPLTSYNAFGKSFCIKRLDQTDVVVPLSSVN